MTAERSTSIVSALAAALLAVATPARAQVVGFGGSAGRSRRLRASRQNQRQGRGGGDRSDGGFEEFATIQETVAFAFGAGLGRWHPWRPRGRSWHVVYTGRAKLCGYPLIRRRPYL